MKKSDEPIWRELGKSKLKNPKGLLAYIRKDLKSYNPKHKKPRFVDSLEMYRGKLLKRTWAYRNHAGKLEYQEIVRKLEGLSCTVVGWCDNNPMGGRVVRFNDDTIGYWGTFWLSNKESYEFFAPLLSKEIIETEYKYCAYDQYKGNLGLIGYMELYNKYPKIELLVKGGYSFLVQYARTLNLNAKSVENIIGLEKQFIPLCQRYSPRTVRKIVDQYKIKSTSEFNTCLEMSNKKYISKYYQPRMKEYLTINLRGASYYDDYLRMAEANGYDMKKNSVLMPQDLTEAHDRANDEMIILIKKEKDEAIIKRSETLAKKEFEKGVYCVVVPQSQQEFIDEGKIIGHCVGGYADKFARGEADIYFVRKADKKNEPLTTVEIRKNKLEQYRGNGKGTRNEKPCDEVIDFIKQWCKAKRIECTI